MDRILRNSSEVIVSGERSEAYPNALPLRVGSASGLTKPSAGGFWGEGDRCFGSYELRQAPDPRFLLGCPQFSHFPVQTLLVSLPVVGVFCHHDPHQF